MIAPIKLVSITRQIESDDIAHCLLKSFLYILQIAYIDKLAFISIE